MSLDIASQESNLSQEETADHLKDSVMIKLYLCMISQPGLLHVAWVRQVSFAGHRSQVIVLPTQEVSQTPLKANLRGLGYFLYW